MYAACFPRGLLLLLSAIEWRAHSTWPEICGGAMCCLAWLIYLIKKCKQIELHQFNYVDWFGGLVSIH